MIYPAIFMVAAAAIDDAEKGAIYRLIYSYIVRRAVCGLTPKNYNKNFERLSAIFLDKGASLQSFRQFFEDATAYTVRFPDDAEFTAALATAPIYRNMGRKERIADILWEIELATRTKVPGTRWPPARPFHRARHAPGLAHPLALAGR